MKTKTTLFLVVLLLGFLSMSGFANASVPEASLSCSNGMSWREVTNRGVDKNTMSSSFISRESTRQKPFSVFKNVGSETVRVNITLNYDKDRYFPFILQFHNNDIISQVWDINVPEGADSFYVMIPQGNYWVDVVYSKTIPQPSPTILIIKEDVNLYSETSITLDASEAVNSITFNPKLPNGEEAIYDLTTFEGELIEDGNCYMSAAITLLYEENSGWFYGVEGGCSRILNDGTIWDYNEDFNIQINPVSSKFTWASARIIASHEGNPIITHVGSYMDKSYNLSNNPADYKLIENKFIHSNNNNLEQVIQQIKYYFGANERIDGCETFGSIKFSSTQIYADLHNIHQFTHTQTFITADYFENMIQEPFAPPVFYGITSTPLATDNQYGIFNYSNGSYYYTLFSAWPQDPISRYNSVYSYSASQCEPIYGKTVPFISFIPELSYSTPNYPFISFGFVGMNGELRTSDLHAAQLVINFNGNKVFDNLLDIENWSYNWFADGANRGVYDISVIDENMMVDDMQGRNETEIHFDLANESNYLPPLLTWMQYRDKDDFVTNSIEEKSGARLLLSAGDFDFHCNEEGHMWFTCRETQPTVKVEYAPHGSTEFTELCVVERPEDFFMPGFGFQYEVALDQVTRKAYGGWFDLRVSLADAAGNSQSQLMSPAFKLEDQSGVESVRETVERVYVDGNDIIAPEGAEIYGTDGLRTDGKGVQPGIYIVRHSDRAVKVRVR